MSDSGRRLPILDLRRFDGDPAERSAFLAELRTVAREVGFFYLAGHGVPAGQAEALRGLARRFFALPEADKTAIELANSPHFRGYTGLGGELTRGRQDWREQLDFGVERPVLPVGPDTPAWTRLQGPNQWPAALPELRPAVGAWQEGLSAVAIKLLRAFSAALEQPEDALAAIHAEAPNHRLKIIRYPGRDVAADDQGVGAHKDGGILTLLLQDRQRGLQVETAEGWIDVEPIEGTLVINIGELLELASNGYLRATVHWVVAPPPGVERLSVAFFFSARLDARVPLLALPPALAAEATGPASDPDNPLFYEVGRNALKARLRSHPDVGQRHYADVLAAPL